MAQYTLNSLEDLSISGFDVNISLPSGELKRIPNGVSELLKGTLKIKISDRKTSQEQFVSRTQIIEQTNIPNKNTVMIPEYCPSNNAIKLNSAKINDVLEHQGIILDKSKQIKIESIEILRNRLTELQKIRKEIQVKLRIPDDDEDVSFDIHLSLPSFFDSVKGGDWIIPGHSLSFEGYVTGKSIVTVRLESLDIPSTHYSVRTPSVVKGHWHLTFDEMLLGGRYKVCVEAVNAAGQKAAFLSKEVKVIVQTSGNETFINKPEQISVTQKKSLSKTALSPSRFAQQNTVEDNLVDQETSISSIFSDNNEDVSLLIEAEDDFASTDVSFDQIMLEKTESSSPSSISPLPEHSTFAEPSVIASNMEQIQPPTTESTSLDQDFIDDWEIIPIVRDTETHAETVDTRVNPSVDEKVETSSDKTDLPEAIPVKEKEIAEESVMKVQPEMGEFIDLVELDQPKTLVGVMKDNQVVEEADSSPELGLLEEEVINTELENMPHLDALEEIIDNQMDTDTYVDNALSIEAIEKIEAFGDEDEDEDEDKDASSSINTSEEQTQNQIAPPARQTPPQHAEQEAIHLGIPLDQIVYSIDGTEMIDDEIYNTAEHELSVVIGKDCQEAYVFLNGEKIPLYRNMTTGMATQKLLFTEGINYLKIDVVNAKGDVLSRDNQIIIKTFAHFDVSIVNDAEIDNKHIQIHDNKIAIQGTGFPYDRVTMTLISEDKVIAKHTIEIGDDACFSYLFSDVEEGQYRLQFSVVDVVDNIGEKCIEHIHVYKHKPVDNTSKALEKKVFTSKHTLGSRPIFRGEGQPGSEVTIRLKRKIYTTIIDKKGRWKYQIPKDLPNGNYTAEIYATDKKGIRSESNRMAFKVQQPKPEMSFGIDGVYIRNGRFYLNEQQSHLVFRGKGTDSGTISVSLNQHIYKKPIFKDEAWVIDFGIAPEGEHFYSVIFEDLAGNTVAQKSSIIIKKIEIAPSEAQFPLFTITTVEGDGYQQIEDEHYTENEQISLSGQLESRAIITSITLNRVEQLHYDIQSSERFWHFNVANLRQGANVILITAMDTERNEITQFSVTVYRDPFIFVTP